MDQYRRTLDSLHEGFQIIGHDWTYLYVNPAAARHGRKAPEELIGRLMWEVYPGINQTPLFDVLQQCMSAREPAALENLFAFGADGERWFELRVEPVPEGLCVHSVDVHDRKEAEAALRRLNVDLEARVGARTRDLEALTRELEAFTYSVSHDLRAPLRHISGFAALLRDECAAGLTEDGRDYVARIIRASHRLEQLIDDLLQFSRAGRASLETSRVNLAELVGMARNDVANEARGRQIDWRIGPLPEVVADPALLRLALVNLLSNAVKFTGKRQSAQIHVTATTDPATGDTTVAIRDNGAGFDMLYADKLFGVFQRLHSTDEFEGTGVGLASVRRIIHRHGGRTWADGALDGGATFYFTLPAAR